MTRTATVLFNSWSFGAWEREYAVSFSVPDGRNFCIEPPHVSEWYAVLYDALWTKQSDIPPHTSLFHDAGEWLPSGQTSREMSLWDQRAADYHAKGRPALRRACWLRPLHVRLGEGGGYHPHLDRALTLEELQTVWAWPSEPLDVDLDYMLATPPPRARAWLDRLLWLCDSDAWGGQDWATDWVPHRWVTSNTISDGQWLANASDPQHKTFDLRRYVGSSFDGNSYDDYKASLHHRCFNVASGTGRLIKTWDAVRRERRMLAPGLVGGAESIMARGVDD